jgi:hypothetical protein
MALAIRNLTFEIKHINTQAIFAVGQSWSDVADRWHTICTYIDLAICRTIVTFKFAKEGCHFYSPRFLWAQITDRRTSLSARGIFEARRLSSRKHCRTEIR